MYKKILLSLIICLLIILFRDNICFFIGNVFGVFKIDNNYYDAIIDIKDDKINYLENEIKESDTFLSNIRLINYNSSPFVSITFLYQLKLFFFIRFIVPVPSSCLST